jgi:hypothetical protein
VFAALAVSREAQARTGTSINKILKTLRPLRTATITLGVRQINVPPRIPAEAQRLLDTSRVVTKPIQLRSDGPFLIKRLLSACHGRRRAAVLRYCMPPLRSGLARGQARYLPARLSHAENYPRVCA